MDLSSKRFLKKVFLLIGLVFLGWFLWEVRTFVIYFVTAVALMLVGGPMIDLIEKIHYKKFRIPRIVSVIVVILIFISFFAVTIGMFIPLISSQAENLSLLNVSNIEKNFTQGMDAINTELIKLGLITDEPQLTQSLEKYFNFSWITSSLQTVFSFIGAIVTGAAAVLFISFFLMKDKEKFTDFLASLFSQQNTDKVRVSITNTQRLLSRYFIGLLIQITSIFVMYLIIMLAFKVNNPVIIAFLGAMLNVIPYLGPIMGYVIIVILTILGNLVLPGRELLILIIKISAAIAIAQGIDNWVSQPLIFSNSVKAHPLEIFCVILIGGILAGVVGMIIAVPTYSALRVIFKEFLPDNRIVRALTKNM